MSLPIADGTGLHIGKSAARYALIGTAQAALFVANITTIASLTPIEYSKVVLPLFLAPLISPLLSLGMAGALPGANKINASSSSLNLRCASLSISAMTAPLVVVAIAAPDTAATICLSFSMATQQMFLNHYISTGRPIREAVYYFLPNALTASSIFVLSTCNPRLTTLLPVVLASWRIAISVVGYHECRRPLGEAKPFEALRYDRESLPSLLKAGCRFLVHSTMGQIRSRLDIILLRTLSTDAILGAYGALLAAWQIINSAAMVPGRLLLQNSNHQDRSFSRNFCLQTTAFGLGAFSFLGLTIFFFPLAWEALGQPEPERYWSVYIIFAACVLTWSVDIFLGYHFTSLGHPRIYLMASAGLLLTTVILMLIGFFSSGLFGMVVGMLISAIVSVVTNLAIAARLAEKRGRP